MFNVWIMVDDQEVKFHIAALNRNQAVRAARRAYPDGVIGSVLPA